MKKTMTRDECVKLMNEEIRKDSNFVEGMEIIMEDFRRGYTYDKKKWGGKGLGEIANKAWKTLLDKYEPNF